MPSRRRVKKPELLNVTFILNYNKGIDWLSLKSIIMQFGILYNQGRVEKEVYNGVKMA